MYKKPIVAGPAGNGPAEEESPLERRLPQDQSVVEFPEVEEVNVVVIPRSEQYTEEAMKAKEDELKKLKEFNAFEEVQDNGQFRISSTWVVTRKGEGVRARLVARGFEEENTNRARKYPSCSKSRQWP